MINYSIFNEPDLNAMNLAPYMGFINIGKKGNEIKSKVKTKSI